MTSIRSGSRIVSTPVRRDRPAVEPRKPFRGQPITEVAAIGSGRVRILTCTFIEGYGLAVDEWQFNVGGPPTEFPWQGFAALSAAANDRK